MLTTMFLVLSVLTTIFLILFITVAIYIKSKNPYAEVSIGFLAYAIPAVLWLATLVSHFVSNFVI